MGWNEVRLRYRRSILGPFWLTISMGILVALLGTIYSGIMDAKTEEYVPYLALGFLAWTFIAGVMNDGCQTFIANENYLKQIGMAMSVFSFNLVWRHFIIFLHNSVVYIVVAIVFRIIPNVNTLFLVPAVALIILNGLWVSIFLGMICARFRDLPPIVASITQVTFFMTPIIWQEDRAGRPNLVKFNPFYHFIEIIRAPALGHSPTAANWAMVFAVTIGGCLLTYLLFSRYRHRITYWL